MEADEPWDLGFGEERFDPAPAPQAPRVAAGPPQLMPNIVHLMFHASQATATERFGRGTAPHRPLPPVSAILLVPWEVVTQHVLEASHGQPQRIDQISVALHCGRAVLQQETLVYDVRTDAAAVGVRTGGTREHRAADNMHVPDAARRWLAVTLVAAPDMSYANKVVANRATALVAPPDAALDDPAVARARAALRADMREGENRAKQLAETIVNRSLASVGAFPEASWHDRLAHLLFVHDNTDAQHRRAQPRSTLTLTSHSQSFRRPPVPVIDENAARLADVHYAVQYQQPFVRFWRTKKAERALDTSLDGHIASVLPYTVALLDTNRGADNTVLPHYWAGKHMVRDVVRALVDARNAAAETTREALAYATRFASVHHVLHEYEAALALELRDMAGTETPLMLTVTLHLAGDGDNVVRFERTVNILAPRTSTARSSVAEVPTRDETADFMYSAAVSRAHDATTSQVAGFANPWPPAGTAAASLALKETRETRDEPARQRAYERLRWGNLPLEQRVALTPVRPRVWVGIDRALFLWQSMQAALRAHREEMTPERHAYIAAQYNTNEAALTDHLARRTPLPMAWAYGVLVLRDLLERPAIVDALLLSATTQPRSVPGSPRNMRRQTSAPVLTRASSSQGFEDSLFALGSQTMQLQLVHDENEFSRLASEAERFTASQLRRSHDSLPGFGEDAAWAFFDNQPPPSFDLEPAGDPMETTVESSLALVPTVPEKLPERERLVLQRTPGVEMEHWDRDVAVCLWRFALNTIISSDLDVENRQLQLRLSGPFPLLTQDARRGTTGHPCAARTDVVPFFVVVLRGRSEANTEAWKLMLSPALLCRSVEDMALEYTLQTQQPLDKLTVTVFINASLRTTGRSLLPSYGVRVLTTPRADWDRMRLRRDPVVEAIYRRATGAPASPGDVALWTPMLDAHACPTIMCTVAALTELLPPAYDPSVLRHGNLPCQFMVSRDGPVVGLTLPATPLLGAETLLETRHLGGNASRLVRVILVLVSRSNRARQPVASFDSAGAVVAVTSWLRAELVNIELPRDADLVVLLVDLYSGFMPWADALAVTAKADLRDLVITHREALSVGLAFEDGEYFVTPPLAITQEPRDANLELFNPDA